jgi:hypothetical protein
MVCGQIKVFDVTPALHRNSEIKGVEAQQAAQKSAEGRAYSAWVGGRSRRGNRAFCRVVSCHADTLSVYWHTTPATVLPPSDLDAKRREKSLPPAISTVLAAVRATYATGGVGTFFSSTPQHCPTTRPPPSFCTTRLYGCRSYDITIFLKKSNSDDDDK